MEPARSAANVANARNAVAAGFLGWTIDAFGFFVPVFTASAIAKEFNQSIPAVVLAITASLATRPIGAFIFGLLADRLGRRIILIANILFYSLTGILSGLAPSYAIFFAMRLLYGVGMGGTWGISASLAMESAPPRWRGVLSGLLQEGYAVGNILAAVAYLLVFPHWGWRAMFFVGAVPALLAIVLCLKVEEPQAWHESRTDWTTYRKAVFGNLPLFLYLIVLTTMMNFISHGTQDLYPTFLQRARGFSVSTTSIISIISMTLALAGGLVFGHMSDRFGRRKSMVTAALLGVLTIPLWLRAPNEPLIIFGAFAMQFMVQGAWGSIPAHMNELSPPQLRGFFPGFAYQCGVLIASTSAYIEARLAEHFSYAVAMGAMAAAVLLIGAVVIWAGPEARGVSFVGRKQAAGS